MSLWKPKFRFGLKMLLVLLTVSGACLGYLSFRAANQRRLVNDILRTGGGVVYDYQRQGKKDGFEATLGSLCRRLCGVDFCSQVVYVELCGKVEFEVYPDPPPKPDAFRMHIPAGLIDRLSGLCHVETLFLFRSDVSDADLRQISRLQSLKWLDLVSTGVTDRAIPDIGNLRKLETLDIRHTHISRKGVARLKKSLPRCHVIAVSGRMKTVPARVRSQD